MRLLVASVALPVVVVTTCYRPDPGHTTRADIVGARLSFPVHARRAFDVMFADARADYLYVIGREREELVRKDGASCFVQPGQFRSKLQLGAAHPLLRAVTSGERIARVFDGTLGLAQDAMHIAAGADVDVDGCEASPVLACLQEGGLARWASSTHPCASAAARVRVSQGQAVDVLRARADDSVDVVYLDPMMSRPKRAAGVFEVLRDFAEPARASPALLLEAVRVAKRRVVLKLGKGAPLPADRPYAFSRHEPGAHVTYWIHDVDD